MYFWFDCREEGFDHLLVEYLTLGFSEITALQFWIEVLLSDQILSLLRVILLNG